MKIWIITLGVLFTVLTAQAAVIDFTDNTAYPVGTDITNHTDWSISVTPGSYAGISGSANGLVVGSTVASEWDSVKYKGEDFYVAIGDAITSSIIFTFQQTGNNGWDRLLGTGTQSGGSFTSLTGYLSRNGNGTGDGSNAPYSLGISKTEESANFTAADLGLLSGGTSDLLQLTVVQTRQGTDLWDTSITLNNLNSSFTASYTKTGLSFGSGDVNSLNGAIFVGEDDAGINVANRTISEFTVVPEPATLGMLGAGTLILLLSRKLIV